MGIKYKVNENFFDSWSKKMAYVLGYIYADGSLEDASYIRGKYLRVSSTDKVTIDNIKYILDSKHKVIETPEYNNNKKQFLLRIGSHKLYESLFKKGLYPNKSLTIRFPIVPKKYLKDYIRGYFDGDGCVHIEKKKNKNNEFLIKRLCVIFSSGSKVFLESLSEIIGKIIKQDKKKIYKNGNTFQLKYSTKDSVELFKFIYTDVEKRIFLERKLGIFREYFILCPKRVDKKVSFILEYLNDHVVK